ncbi:TIGR03546 family protein [Arcobacteraceae bacterium]|nr:TIGR03546 family protein [Arcobacteraceae bacterium]
MFTLKKIWNALNHAGKPWQIAMAVALGMLVGFTPILSIHNILVLFIVLIFNIHLAVFLLAVSFFGLIGLALDPLFAILGKIILTSNGLDSLFTSWFNNPFGHLTYFNNTITMGSLVVSLVLFFIVYKMSAILLTKYRTVIAVKIKNIPLLNKMNFFKQEEQSAVKTIRLAGVVVIIALVGLVSIFNIVFLDNIIKNNIETVVNESSNKNIKIGGLSTSFFNSSINIQNLEISDKKKKDENINVKNITLDISLGQLIFERAIIDNLKVDGISFPSDVVVTEKTESKSTSNNKPTSETKKKSPNITDLNSLNKINIQKDFDKEIKNQFEKYKGYYEQIKPLFNKEQETVQKRDDGKYVYYPLESTLPQFLIKQGTFSIIKNEFLINGSFKDFTTNQYLYQKPFVIFVNTEAEKIGNVIVNGSFIETKKLNQDKLNIKLNGYSISDQEEKNFSISNTVIDTEMDLNILNKSKINGAQSIKVLTTDIQVPKSNKYIVILNKSLIQTKGIKANVAISGTLSNPKFKINSNIDSIIKKKVKAVLKSQKNAIKDEVKNKVKDKVKDKLNDKLDGKLKGILGF